MDMPRIVREAAEEVPSLGARLSKADEARKASKKRGACAALLSRWFPMILASLIPALMVCSAIFPLLENDVMQISLYRVVSNGTSVPSTGSLKISAGFAVAQKSVLTGIFFAILIWTLSLTDDVPMCFGVKATGKFEAVAAAVVAVMLLTTAVEIESELEDVNVLRLFEDPSRHIANAPIKAAGYKCCWAAVVLAQLQLLNNLWCRVSYVTRRRDHMGWREPFWEIRPLVAAELLMQEQPAESAKSALSAKKGERMGVRVIV